MRTLGVAGIPDKKSRKRQRLLKQVKNTDVKRFVEITLRGQTMHVVPGQGSAPLEVRIDADDIKSLCDLIKGELDTTAELKNNGKNLDGIPTGYTC